MEMLVPALLERDAELLELDGLLHAPAAAKADLALIEGPAGMGKTRLLAAARERAPQTGMQVLSGSGSELERESPFALARQLFEPALTSAASKTRERWLAGA